MITPIQLSLRNRIRYLVAEYSSKQQPFTLVIHTHIRKRVGRRKKAVLLNNIIGSGPVYEMFVNQEQPDGYCFPLHLAIDPVTTRVQVTLYGTILIEVEGGDIHFPIGYVAAFIDPTTREQADFEIDLQQNTKGLTLISGAKE